MFLDFVQNAHLRALCCRRSRQIIKHLSGKFVKICKVRNLTVRNVHRSGGYWINGGSFGSSPPCRVRTSVGRPRRSLDLRRPTRRGYSKRMPLRSSPKFNALMVRNRLAGVFAMVMLLAMVRARPNILRDKEIEEQLISLNKPAVKTIMSEDGDVVDCVDIYKQPAFNHPLLKNHTIQMRPSFIPRVKKGKNFLRGQIQQTWQKSGSCPEGTIPIQRIRDYNVNQDFDNCKVEVARAELHTGGPYIGAHAIINVWNLSVEANEWSVSSVTVFNLLDSFVEAGWAVIPSFYGDSSPQLFARWLDTTTGKGCFNLRCPGFIQVTNGFMLGGKFETFSQYDGDQYTIMCMIYKDVNKGDWWMAIQDGQPGNWNVVGYWPSQLIAEFKGSPRINWGGSICDTEFKGFHTRTQMGSGRHPDEFRRASFIRSLMVMDSLREMASVEEIELSADTKGCYEVMKTYFDGDDGPAIYYGGPGGTCCDMHCKK